MVVPILSFNEIYLARDLPGDNQTIDRRIFSAYPEFPIALVSRLLAQDRCEDIPQATVILQSFPDQLLPE